jgi:hypothetical protein
LLYFSGPSVSLMPALLSVENWVPLMPVLGAVRDVALIYYPSCTDSNKPSLQFLCNFVVINASEGSLCFQIFIFIYIRYESPLYLYISDMGHLYICIYQIWVTLVWTICGCFNTIMEDNSQGTYGYESKTTSDNREYLLMTI